MKRLFSILLLAGLSATSLDAAPAITGTWRAEQSGGTMTIAHVAENRYSLKIQDGERKMNVEGVLSDNVLTVKRAMMTMITITFAPDGRTAELKSPRGVSRLNRIGN